MEDLDVVGQNWHAS